MDPRLSLLFRSIKKSSKASSPTRVPVVPFVAMRSNVATTESESPTYLLHWHFIGLNHRCLLN